MTSQALLISSPYPGPLLQPAELVGSRVWRMKDLDSEDCKLSGFLWELAFLWLHQELIMASQEICLLLYLVFSTLELGSFLLLRMF